MEVCAALQSAIVLKVGELDNTDNRFNHCSGRRLHNETSGGLRGEGFLACHLQSVQFAWRNTLRRDRTPIMHAAGVLAPQTMEAV